MDWLDADVANHLKRAQESGVKIIFDGEKREICNVEFTKCYLNNGNYPESDLKITNEAPYILATHRTFDDGDLFMLVNTASDDFTSEISLKLNASSRLYLVDLNSGERRPLDYTLTEGRARLSINIPAYETVIIGRL